MVEPVELQSSPVGSSCKLAYWDVTSHHCLPPSHMFMHAHACNIHALVYRQIHRSNKYILASLHYLHYSYSFQIDNSMCQDWNTVSPKLDGKYPWSPGPRFFTYTHIVAGWYSHCLLISPFWLMHIMILDSQPLNFVGKNSILAVKVPHFWWQGPFIRACWHCMSDPRSLCRAYRALALSWVGWQMARWHVTIWRVFAGYVWISKIDYTQGTISDYEIFTPLRVGWPPTPQVYFGPWEGLRVVFPRGGSPS